MKLALTNEVSFMRACHTDGRGRFASGQECFLFNRYESNVPGSAALSNTNTKLRGNFEGNNKSNEDSSN